MMDKDNAKGRAIRDDVPGEYKCAWEYDEICCNVQSPYCCTFCPALEWPRVCVFFEAKDHDKSR